MKKIANEKLMMHVSETKSSSSSSSSSRFCNEISWVIENNPAQIGLDMLSDVKVFPWCYRRKNDGQSYISSKLQVFQCSLKG